MVESSKTLIKALCHPEKRHLARGLCSLCYSKQYAIDHPDIHRNSWKRLKQDPRKELLKAAKRRAKKRNRAFSLTLNDIIIPQTCPILDLSLHIQNNLPNECSPSLDEITIGKGYVKDNIQIISRKANTMKSNATPEELLKFSEWIRKTYAS